MGGWKGWHLSTLEQLTSLVDTSNSNPSLPTGHPFQNVPVRDYWSTTLDLDNPADAWRVSLGSGNIGTFPISANGFAWCLRGGQSFDGNTSCIEPRF